MQKAKEGLGTTLMLSEEEYNTVKENIRVATNISDVIDLYEKAMSGRITKDEYNFLAKQTAAVDAIDEHVKHNNKALASNDSTKYKKEDNTNWFTSEAWKDQTNVTLDEVLQAKLDTVVENAKKAINEVEVKNGNYATATIEVTTAEDEGKNAIDEVYKFAVQKTHRIKEYDKTYTDQLKALDTLFASDADDVELNAAKAELTRLYNEGKVARQSATTADEYNEIASEVPSPSLSDYCALVSKKHAEKLALDDTYTKTIKGNSGSGTGTEEEYIYLDQLKKAVQDGKAAIDAATIVGTVIGQERGSVEKAKKDAEDAIKAIDKLNEAAKKVKKDIEDFRDTLGTDKIVPGTTEKYVDIVKGDVENAIAQLGTFTTEKAITDYETVAKNNMLNSLKTYLKTTLDTLSNKKGSKDTDKVLSLACLKALNENKDAIDGWVIVKGISLESVVTDFNGYADLEDLSALKAEMAREFNTVMVTKATNGLGKTPDSKVTEALDRASKYADLAEVKAILDTVPDRFANVTSAKDYEGIAGSNDSQGLRNALLVALRTKLADVLSTNEGKPADVTNVRNATTIENAIKLFEDNFPQGE